MLNRRDFLRTVCASAGLLALTQTARAARQTVARPNVILLMTDDQGWGDASYQGHPELKTPNIDAMAAGGLVFNRWYAAAPVCSPTRASCLTGRHPSRMGIGGANDGCLPHDEINLAEVLRAHGYRTGHFGKWHLGTLTRVVKDSNRGGPHADDIYAPPWDHGFDVCFSTESRTPTWDPMVAPDLVAGPLRRGQEAGQSFQTYYWTGPGEIATDNLEGDDSRIIMDRALPFMEASAAAGRPFFAVVWLHAPHEPIVAGPAYRERYGDLPEEKQHFYGVLSAVDDQIGRLRERLRELGIADDTMIWYCSDNGPAAPRTSLRAVGQTGGLREQKGSLYEGGVRVPGILEWPGHVEGGRTTDVPCCTSDYYPTVLDLLGLDLPGSHKMLDGISLAPVLSGKAEARPQPIAFHFNEQAALIDNRYKIVTPHIDRRDFELYDLVADPSESENLADAQPDRVEEMRAHWEAWRASVKDEP